MTRLSALPSTREQARHALDRTQQLFGVPPLPQQRTGG
jgi:hypothetical protein